MKILARTLLDSSYYFTMTLLINMDAEISILLFQRFLEKKILSLLSDHPRKCFDNLYQEIIMGRGNLGSSTVNETSTIMWDALQSHEVMAEFSKHEVKCHPSITSIFSRFLITANISEPLQNISHMNRDIKVLSTKSDRHCGRLNNIKE